MKLISRQNIQLYGPVIAVWSILRIFTIIWGAIVSEFRPLTNIEQTTPVWLPIHAWDQWLYRVLLSPWLRWDVHWYQRIAVLGYQTTDGTAQFHPLYPWIATLFIRLGIDALLSLITISSVSSILLLLTFTRLAQFDLDEDGSRTAALLMVTFPSACVLFTPYSESLFLWLSVLCLLMARQGRWWLAGMAGAMASLTRQQGVFLVIPLLLELWEASERKWAIFRLTWREILAIGLVPTGLMAWLLYRLLFLSDVHPDLSNFQSLLYSVLISPSASQVVQVQAFLWPWQTLGLAVQKFWNNPDVDLIANLVMGGYFLLVFIMAWKKMRLSYRWYSVVIFLVSFGYYTGPIHPYMGLPRHLLLAFPLFIGLGGIIRRSQFRLLWVGIGLLGNSFLIMLFVLESWVL